MKINGIFKNQYIPNFKSASQDYANLSGENEFKKYNREYCALQNEKAEKATEVQGVIYNTVETLAAYGKYKAAKLLFKEIENEEELKEDSRLYNAIAGVYKKENDPAKAAELYETAYNHADRYNLKDFVNTEKNYIETLLLLNQNQDEAIQAIGKRKDVFSNLAFLELDSLNNLKKGDTQKSKDEILSAYFLAKNNNIISDDLYYKAAVMFCAEGNYEKSNEICKTRLDKLNKEKKIYTVEFLNYLSLLGINNANCAKDENDTKIAIDTLQNALDIEKAIPSPLIRENIEYNILKLKFKTPDNSVLKAANDFVEYSKNNSFNKELSALAGDYCAAHGNNELALIYYQNAEVFAEKIDEIKSPELLELYNKIIALDPQKEPEYIEKISSLQDTKDLSTKQLIDAFEFNFKKNDNERIMSMANATINNPQSSDQSKEIARTYKLFAGIDNGDDFRNNLSQLNSNLEKLSKIYRTDRQNKFLGKHLYRSYTRLSSINYDASQYYDAAINAQKAQNYINLMKPTEEDLKKSKIYLTLLFYKAHSYCSAESNCLDYLKMLTGYDSSQIKSKSASRIIDGKSDTESRKIAAALETLGIINLKNKNYNDAKNYYKKAIDLRENLRLKDIYLANDYAALARIAIAGYWSINEDLSSKELHNKCLKILKDRYPNEIVTREEEEFHKKYYGIKMASIFKYVPFRNKDYILDNFKCFNKELNICE